MTLKKRNTQYNDISKPTTSDSVEKSSFIWYLTDRSFSTESLLTGLLNSSYLHIIHKHREDSQQETQCSEIMLNQPDLFFEDPISNILGDAAADPIPFKFDCHNQKQELMQTVSDHINSQPKLKIKKVEILTIVSELFTNALFNAPKTVDRDKDKKLIRTKEAELLISHTHSNKVVIACRDQYGTLNPLDVIARVKDTLQKGLGESIRWNSKTGPGIGIRMIADLCSSLYLAVSPGKETLVCCTLPLGSEKLWYEHKTINLHLITGNSGTKGELK